MLEAYVALGEEMVLVDINSEGFHYFVTASVELNDTE